jgi:hypothetical protein
MKLEITQESFIKPSISALMKICPLGADLCIEDRWASMTKLIAVTCNLSNRPKAQFKSSLHTQHSKFAAERNNDNKPLELLYL